MNQTQEWRKELFADSAEGAGKQTEHRLTPDAIRRTGWIVLPLLAVLLLVWQVSPDYVLNEDQWLSLHSILETFSIVVSLLIFGIGWHSYSQGRSGNMVLLACAYLAVGLIDYAHVMSYPGMPDFVTSSNLQTSILFWLAARFLGGMALLSAALLPWKPFSSQYTRYGFLAGSLSLVALIYWVGLFHEDIIPETYIPGQGVTPFKTGAEYLVMALYAAAAIVLMINLRKPQPFDGKNLLVSALVMIMGEVWFTRYVVINDLFNFLGHMYKIIAYLFLYRAVFVNNVREPFQRLYESERLLKKSEEWLFTTLTSIGDAVIATDSHGRVHFMNPVAERVTGWTLEEAAGKDIKEIFHIINETTQEEVESPVTKALREGTVVGLANHTVLIAKDGSEIPIDDSAALIRTEQGSIQGVVLVFRDVTERKRMEELMQYLAYHDALTGLPNRTFFLDRLTQSIANAQRNQHMLAVLFLDLNRFKFINDTLGHRLEDLLLQEAAERLTRCVRKSDTVSRLGGDEFVILLSDLSAREDAVKVAEKILEALSQPFVLNGQEFSICTSIGISLYPTDGNDGEILVRNADMAMYHAKERGNHYQFFLSSMGVLSSERLKLENDLRKALEREEFFLHYQPKVDLNTGEIIGVEALVRWQHPELGMVSPVKFIPVAEETGLILPLGEWVLRTACRQNKAWQEEGLPPVRMAVNLSMAQFQQKNLTEMITLALKETGLSPHFLELEVTESVVMRNPETTSQILQELKELGIQISLDDFGTGYSSLSYLRQLPLDALKIDQSFIRNIKTNPDEMSIVKAIIDLAHSLKMKVITEGVETEDQVQVLRSCQCDEIQGYYFSPPVSAEEFKELLHKGSGL